MSKIATAKSQTAPTPKPEGYIFGRPTKYKREYCQQLIEYFNIQPYYERKETITNLKTKQKYYKYRTVANDLPSLVGFACKLGVTRDTLNEWANAVNKDNKLKHKDFSDAIKKAKEYQEYIWQTNSLKGLYNTAFTIFAGKNIFNWKEKSEITGKGDTPLVAGFNYVTPDKPNDADDNSDNKTNL